MQPALAIFLTVLTTQQDEASQGKRGVNLSPSHSKRISREVQGFTQGKILVENIKIFCKILIISLQHGYLRKGVSRMTYSRKVLEQEKAPLDAQDSLANNVSWVVQFGGFGAIPESDSLRGRLTNLKGESGQTDAVEAVAKRSFPSDFCSALGKLFSS